MKCYLEPNCVSVNFGPQEEGSHVCELNNATDESPTLSKLLKRKRYTYHGIEVCNKGYLFYPFSQQGAQKCVRVNLTENDNTDELIL